MEAGSTPRGAGSGSRGGRERAAGPSKQRTGSRQQSGASLQAAGHRQPQHRGTGTTSPQGGASGGASPARQKQRKPNVFKKKMDPVSWY